MPRYIVLLGPPGAGKGTQAKLLIEKTGLVHISSGDIFRENIKNKTELGINAQTFINRGELVPDDLTIAMIKERFSRPDCEKGAILDGFPRTKAQADALDKMLADFDGKVDLVPFITAAEEVLVDRLSGRWSCRDKGHVYHEKFNPPKTPGVCDLDGSKLYQRDDDKAETVKRRILVYMKETSPLIAFYTRQGKLIKVDGAQPIEQVTLLLVDALESKNII
jgi:adenylate kinase